MHVKFTSWNPSLLCAKLTRKKKKKKPDTDLKNGKIDTPSASPPQDDETLQPSIDKEEKKKNHEKFGNGKMLWLLNITQEMTAPVTRQGRPRC